MVADRGSLRCRDRGRGPMAEIDTDAVVVGQPRTRDGERPKHAEQRSYEKIFRGELVIELLEPRHRLQGDDGGQHLPALGNDARRQDQPLQPSDDPSGGKGIVGNGRDGILEAGQGKQLLTEPVSTPGQQIQCDRRIRNGMCDHEHHDNP